MSTFSQLDVRDAFVGGNGLIFNDLLLLPLYYKL